MRRYISDNHTVVFGDLRFDAFRSFVVADNLADYVFIFPRIHFFNQMIIRVIAGDQQQLSRREHAPVQPEKCHRPREDDDDRPYQIDHQWRRCRKFLILHADLEIGNDIGKYHRQYLRVDQIAPFQERYLKSAVQLHKENKQESIDEYHHPVTPAEERRPDNLVVPIDPDDTIESCQKRNQYQGKSQLDQALVLLKLIHAFVFWFLSFTYLPADGSPVLSCAFLPEARPPPSRSACGCACVQSFPERRIMVPGQLGCCRLRRG